MNENRSPASSDARLITTDARHFSYRIPIRMTPDERKIIGKSAQALNRSVSRYLVELATKGPAFRPEEKARLRFLLSLFREARGELEGVLGMSRFADITHSRADVCAKVREAMRLLSSLVEQLERRLHE